MSKETTTPAPIIIDSYVHIENFEVDVWNHPMQVLDFSFTGTLPATTPHTKMLLSVKNLPCELSDKLAAAILRGMTSQAHYNKLINLLNTL